MARLRFFQSLHFKIASAVIATIVLISTLAFLADYRSTRARLLAELEQSAKQLADISLQGLLELAMLGQHPDLLQQAIERLENNSSVDRILLLDMEGVVHFASRPEERQQRFTVEQQGCRECHKAADSAAPESVFLEIGGREILRNVSLVPNRAECHGCHSAEPSHNGILVIDFQTAGVWQRLASNFYDALLRVGLTVVFTLLVLGLLMNKLVIGPLEKLTGATARLDQGGESAELESLEGSDEIGQLAGTFGVMRRQIHRSFEELQSQKDHLQELMNSLPDGLIVVDREFRLEMANRAARGLWNERQLGEILTEQTDLPEIGLTLQKALRSRALVTCEIKLESPSALPGRVAPRFMEIHCSPVPDGERVEQIVLLIRDITRRKRFETEASRADRLASVGRLAAGLAHEINNPMAAITTCIEGLSRHVAASDEIGSNEKREIHEYLATVGEASLRCKDITQRLLSASEERDSGEFEPLDLWQIVEQTVTLVQHQAQKQGASIRLQPPRGGFRVSGNHRKLAQLTLNLFLNGLEALQGEGRIEASLSRRDGFIVLRVSDNGAGIADQDVERIFDPFFTTKTHGQGTGLGLTISEWIVRQHQGRLQVTSKVGHGTTFSIFFPALGDTTS